MTYRIPASKELSRLLYEAYQRGTEVIRIVSEPSRWYVEADPVAPVRAGALVLPVRIPPQTERFRRREAADAVVSDMTRMAEQAGGITPIIPRSPGAGPRRDFCA